MVTSAYAPHRLSKLVWVNPPGSGNSAPRETWPCLMGGVWAPVVPPRPQPHKQDMTSLAFASLANARCSLIQLGGVIYIQYVYTLL